MSEIIIAQAKYDVHIDPSSQYITFRLTMAFPLENQEQNHKLIELLDHIENDGVISIVTRPNIKISKNEPDEKWGNW